MINAAKLFVPRFMHPGNCADRSLKKLMRNATVASGPFRGMRYIAESQGSLLLPKLVGIYELELAEQVKRYSAIGYADIYVVGAGEGYYAVGFALASPISLIHAYEAHVGAHHLIRELATINRVEDRVVISGVCHVIDLARSMRPNAFIFMDVEGAERALLDPESVPQLKTAEILFESHFSPEETQSHILSKFANTHSVERIDTRERTWRDLAMYPKLYSFYIRRMLKYWFDEMRGGPMQWYCLTPR